MSKLTEAFQNRKAFIPFLTCGDPNLETTAANIRALAAAGAAVIELGIPFSDPTAEGPLIQGANIRALQGGVTTDKIFEFVRKVRTDVKIPFVFMTYANVVFSYGTERFIKNCAEFGIDGILLFDIPYEEKEEFASVCKQNGVAFISTIAPTSKQRIAPIASDAEGYLYVITEAGGEQVSASELIAEIRKSTSIPCVVANGILKPEHAKNHAPYVDGISVDTAITEIVVEYGKESPLYVSEFGAKMVAALK